MELRKEDRVRFRFWKLVGAAIVLVVAGVFALPRPAPLTPTEASCIGSWAFINPDHPGKICIVYHFAADRNVREEHYYLTSARPTVPRITMRGKWGIDANARLTVEPNDGMAYSLDAASGWLNEYFDDGYQAWTRPVLTRFYDITSVTSDGIHVEVSRSGGGREKLTMSRFMGNPVSASIQ